MFDEFGLCFVVLYVLELFDWDVIFGCSVLCIFEIGFGMGVLIVEIVVYCLGDDFFGVEVYELGVGVLLKLIGE